MGAELVTLERRDEVFVLHLAAGENRWNTTFVRQFAAALDEVEASEGPAALLTVSDDAKFFSNGLDLDWITSRGDHPGGDRSVFAAEAMALFGRVITLPVPTVCAIGGHGFGAGLMIALCHDVRIMREDRGYLCANEVELGMAIPEPELALFRHKMSMDAFVQTVLLARRWDPASAREAGIVQQLVPADQVLDAGLEAAAGYARLGRKREVMGWMKEHLFGEGAAINGPDGPAHMLRNSTRYPSGPMAVARPG